MSGRLNTEVAHVVRSENHVSRLRVSDIPYVQLAIAPDGGAPVQRPAHRAEGATTVACDRTCVYTEVAFMTPHGELSATAATPRAFLASSFATQLSNDGVGLLTVLNAGVPRRAAKAAGWQKAGLPCE